MPGSAGWAWPGLGQPGTAEIGYWTGFLIEAILRKRLIHRGIRVDAWVGSMLSTELTSMPR